MWEEESSDQRLSARYPPLVSLLSLTWLIVMFMPTLKTARKGKGKGKGMGDRSAVRRSEREYQRHMSDVGTLDDL